MNLLDQKSEIKAIRQYLGLSKIGAANFVGYSVRYWQYWESGERKIPQSVFWFLDARCIQLKKIVSKYSEINFVELPYYLNYEDFVSSGYPNPKREHYELWNTIASKIRFNGRCVSLSGRGIYQENESIWRDFKDLFVKG